jgi:glucose 1-dehydrogenase
MHNPLADFNLSGRAALVTGARREIGRAIALALGAQGARVAVHHRGTEEEERDAALVVEEIRGAGQNAEAFAMDFTEDQAGTRLAAAVTATFGHVDILVLNASIEQPEDFTAVSRAHFDNQIKVNLLSTLELLQALVPPMGARGWGRVLAIGSIQQLQPHPSMLVYAGTKAAQMNWVINLARRFGPLGVTVNNLAPGAILTARNRAQMAREGEAFIGRVPIGRLGAPDDLVGAALLLCSEAGRYITGVNLLVDGGRHIG